MESPVGTITVEETLNETLYTFRLEGLKLGTTASIELWNSIVVSYNGRKVVASIND